ncbi:MAG: glycosyltransferase [Acidobacteriota bacterium]
MKILLLSPNFAPERTGIGVSATDTARALQRLGHEVSVLTSVPYYPEWQVPERYRRKLRIDETVHGISVTRLGRYVPQRPRTWNRIVHELSFAVPAALRLLARRADLVVCISPPLPLAVLAGWICALQRRRYWVYVQDIQPDTAVTLGMLRARWLRWALAWLERRLYRVAERVLVLSQDMGDNVRRKVPGASLAELPLLVDVEDLAVELTPERRRAVRAEMGAGDEDFLLFYSGNLGVKHDPETLVACAREARPGDPVRIAIAGAGAREVAVREALAELGDDPAGARVRLLELGSRQQLAERLAAADALVLLQRAEVEALCVPSKLITYLASGTPVIAAMSTGSSLAADLERSGGVVQVAPSDADAILEAARELAGDPTRARGIGARGARFVRQQFHRDVVLRNYYEPLFGKVSSLESVSSPKAD